MNDLKEDLYITVYMRALEVRHFPPSIFVETYLMAKKLKEEIPTIKSHCLLFCIPSRTKSDYGCYRESGNRFVKREWTM